MNLATRTLASLLVLAQAAFAQVSVSQSGSKLKIQGGDGDDAVIVFGAVAFGEVAVSDGGPFDFYVGVRDVEVSLGDGDDFLKLTALQIGGSLNATLGDGADVVDVADESDVGRFLVARNGFFDLGDDVGDRCDIAAMAEHGVLFGGKLVVKGVPDLEIDGAGASHESQARDVFVAGDLRVRSNVGHDVDGDDLTLRLDDVNVGGTTRVDLGGSHDDVRIERAHFAGPVVMKLGQGFDLVRFGDVATEFNASFAVFGGGGVDSVEDVSALILAHDPKFKQVEAIEPLP